jgi:hypothetical protein
LKSIKNRAKNFCPNRLAKIIATPTTPPSIKLLGIKKTSMAKAARKAP